MWRATVGDRAVYLLTWAASAIFSCGVRGVPGVPNILNRVPELPNAHEGSSIACSARRGAMDAKSVMTEVSCSGDDAVESFQNGGRADTMREKTQRQVGPPGGSAEGSARPDDRTDPLC